jgi:DNA-binding transcriptional LysR family regulator
VGRNDVPWPIVIELRELRSVGALVEELHFGRAAARLGVTPSTLSRRIVHLERELGVSLFVRTSRRVALTDAGRRLATRLPAALRQLDAALAAAQAGDDGGWEI